MNQGGLVVLTSGGDAQGMNAAVRSVVRCALASEKFSCVYAAWNGYEGVVEGGEGLIPLKWSDVADVMHLGGTFLGTARSDRFRTKEGRRAAVRNLIERDISCMVVIGGDGSLTGAHVLQREWREHVGALSQKGSPEPQEVHERELRVVGLVGSIDNDVAGTDLTIGCDSALHRITSSLDMLASTAASHRRSFVVEVMGRHCGWLALLAAIVVGADYLFIPEYPASVEWKQHLNDALATGKRLGKRSGVVVVAEGALDTNGDVISSDLVRKAMLEAGVEARLTILGHVQRGGAPSALDRSLSQQMGAKAIEALTSLESSPEPLVVCLTGESFVLKKLSVCLEQNQKIRSLIVEGQYAEAMRIRGPDFERAFQVFHTLIGAPPPTATPSAPACPFPSLHRTSLAVPPPSSPNLPRLSSSAAASSSSSSPSYPPSDRPRIAVVHIGACSPGMNAAVRSLVRHGIVAGHMMLGVRGGAQGLMEGSYEELSWMCVNGWTHMGGAQLGVDRFDPADLDCDRVLDFIRSVHLSSLVMIGGWDGYLCMHKIAAALEQASDLSLFRIACIPATISHNIPVTRESIGADSALNEICVATDKIKQSTVGHKRAYVVEVMGSRCGYLASMGALVSGAELAFLHERSPTLATLHRDITRLVHSISTQHVTSVTIAAEGCSKTFDTSLIARLYRSESGGAFDVRTAVLGHVQQGASPSPRDRYLATMMGASAIELLSDPATPSACCLSVLEGDTVPVPLDRVVAGMDMKNRRPRQQHWLPIMDLYSLLADSQALRFEQIRDE